MPKQSPQAQALADEPDFGSTSAVLRKVLHEWLQPHPAPGSTATPRAHASTVAIGVALAHRMRVAIAAIATQYAEPRSGTVTSTADDKVLGRLAGAALAACPPAAARLEGRPLTEACCAVVDEAIRPLLATGHASLAEPIVARLRRAGGCGGGIALATRSDQGLVSASSLIQGNDVALHAAGPRRLCGASMVSPGPGGLMFVRITAAGMLALAAPRDTRGAKSVMLMSASRLPASSCKPWRTAAAHQALLRVCRSVVVSLRRRAADPTAAWVWLSSADDS